MFCNRKSGSWDEQDNSDRLEMCWENQEMCFQVCTLIIIKEKWIIVGKRDNVKYVIISPTFLLFLSSSFFSFSVDYYRDYFNGVLLWVVDVLVVSTFVLT